MKTQSFASKMLSKFKNGLNSWISLWRFLVNLENLDFYEGLDEREIQRTRAACQGSDLCAATFLVNGKGRLKSLYTLSDLRLRPDNS